MKTTGTPLDEAEAFLEVEALHSGLLVSRGPGGVRFWHRTFQEYLAARHLSNEGFPDLLVELAKADIERWREAVLLAAAKVARGTKFATWSLAATLCPPGEPAAPPGDPQWWLTLLAGQMIVETGIAFDPKLSMSNQRCREHIVESLQCLVDGGHVPPVDRAAAGIALAKLGDRRKGVRLGADGLPDIDWIALPAGEFVLGETGEPAVIGQPFGLSRHPVTWAQFQAFVAADGYRDAGTADDDSRLLPWWGAEGLAWKRQHQISGPGNENDPAFQTPNHPRAGVSWYEAMAFCRWLSHESKQEITLPAEAQWEWAARWNRQTGQAGERPYPWDGGEDDLAHRCNMGGTGIGHTSAVGMFPGGKADCGAMDMSGNVWEWCENLYETGKPYRVLRGGSWISAAPRSLRSASRFSGHPGVRVIGVGFRVVCVVVGSAGG